LFFPPVCGGVNQYPGGSERIGVGQKPVPALPNAIFGPSEDFTHAWASFRASRVFGPVPRRSLFCQTKP
jgi:hypothetical protein